MPAELSHDGMHQGMQQVLPEGPTRARAQAAECRAASSARIASMTGRIRSRADSAVEHLAQPGGERVRVAGLAVLPAQEAAVVAREPRRLNPEGSGDSHRAALRE
jgi:hypothetical protein